MKPRYLSLSGIAFCCMFIAAFPAFGQQGIFGYQGRLNDNGSPATGSYDLQFTLWATPTGGSPVAGPVTKAPTAVSNGLFAVALDFGAGVFNGADRWMEIAVRPFGSAGAYRTLTPRVPLAATPYAIRAQNVSSVADAALSANVVLLDGSPMFSTPVRAPMLRVANSAGGGVLSFGNNPDNLCAISVDPAGPAGLLLRDPRGIRILSPDPQQPPTLRFGPTDDCSIGIDPAFPGLVERDPIGFRLLGQNNQGCRLIFGPTMACTVEVDPAGPAGLLLRDPKGIRILPPSVAGTPALPRLLFGPTDDCSIGVDPAGPQGLLLRDPRGVRIAPTDPVAVPRLLFGPTDDCSIGVDPAGPQGLLLRDPRGVRIAPTDPMALPRLLFGPTDDCSIGIDPGLPGLILRDPSGLRIAPAGANALPRLLFGPTDDCSIGIDPAFPGLIERDPIGFRLLGLNSQGSRLIFGPTNDCTVEIRPPGTPNAVTGLLLRDPSGIRLLNPVAGGSNTILFGPTDDCRIVAVPGTGAGAGLRFFDPRGSTFGSQVTVNGPVSAQAFVQTSSRRFKDDVQPIEQPLEKISQLKGVRFTWKKEKGGQRDIGFIAEEVAKVIPEVVTMEEDGKNARGVNYDHLVAVAIEGIKAQQSQIQTLERENAGLKESLQAMQAKLDRLSQKLDALPSR